MVTKREEKNPKDRTEPKIAYIESIVTDQGNGGSYCSNCDQDLTSLCWEQVKVLGEIISPEARQKGRIPEIERKLDDLYICPGCGYRLKDGGVYISGGDSDF